MFFSFTLLCLWHYFNSWIVWHHNALDAGTIQIICRVWVQCNAFILIVDGVVPFTYRSKALYSNTFTFVVVVAAVVVVVIFHPSWKQIVIDLGGWKVACFLFHSSFLQAVSTVMLFGKFLKLLSTSVLQSCGPLWSHCSCRSICLFIYSDPGMRYDQDSRSTEVFEVEVRAWPRAVSDSTFCSSFIESVRTIAWVIFVPLGEAIHGTMCLTASSSMVRPEVVTVQAQLSSCTIPLPCFTVKPRPNYSLGTEICVDHDVACCWLQWAFLFLHFGFPCCCSLQFVTRRFWQQRLELRLELIWLFPQFIPIRKKN